MLVSCLSFSRLFLEGPVMLAETSCKNTTISCSDMRLKWSSCCVLRISHFSPIFLIHILNSIAQYIPVMGISNVFSIHICCVFPLISVVFGTFTTRCLQCDAKVPNTAEVNGNTHKYGNGSAHHCYIPMYTPEILC